MRQKPTQPSLSSNVLLKAHIYHMVAYVNKKCLGRGNYENYAVVRTRPWTLLYGQPEQRVKL
jgi:hypothetical protein